MKALLPLYRTAAWRQRRRQQLEAEPLCRICRLQYNRMTPAVAVDHIEQPKDEQSFWTMPLQSLCMEHHRQM